jgi:hypothetical protein
MIPEYVNLELISVGSYYNPVYDIELSYTKFPAQDVVLDDLEYVKKYKVNKNQYIQPCEIAIYQTSSFYIAYVSNTPFQPKHKFKDEIKGKKSRVIFKVYP